MAIPTARPWRCNKSASKASCRHAVWLSNSDSCVTDSRVTDCSALKLSGDLQVADGGDPLHWSKRVWNSENVTGIKNSHNPFRISIKACQLTFFLFCRAVWLSNCLAQRVDRIHDFHSFQIWIDNSTTGNRFTRPDDASSTRVISLLLNFLLKLWSWHQNFWFEIDCNRPAWPSGCKQKLFIILKTFRRTWWQCKGQCRSYKRDLLVKTSLRTRC